MGFPPAGVKWSAEPRCGLEMLKCDPVDRRLSSWVANASDRAGSEMDTIVVMTTATAKGGATELLQLSNAR
jgi:hypothetical protein